MGWEQQKRNMFLYLSVLSSSFILITSLSLDFSYSRLTAVPAPPEDTFVYVLILQGNTIEELDSQSFQHYRYTRVHTLNLAANGLRVINDGTFDNFVYLLFLDLRSNHVIQQLPSTFGPSTPHVTYFSLWAAIGDPGILTYPYFAAFTSMTSLNIGWAVLGTINASILPPNAIELILKYDDINLFPQLSLYARQAEVLRIQHNNVEVIPQDHIDGLTELRELWAGGNRIGNFPNFSHCIKMTILSLPNNEIPYISRGYIEGLDSIIEMDFANNQLTDMPHISHLDTLEKFLIGFNQITTIPTDFIVGLPNLKIFACNNNNITFLPNISLFVPNLSELYVQGNRLQMLPDLYDMMSLLVLEAADNPFLCNSSLCWLRMLSWMRPWNTMLRDQPVCEGPATLANVSTTRAHPTLMQCYEGRIPILQLGKMLCAGDGNFPPWMTRLSNIINTMTFGKCTHWKWKCHHFEKISSMAEFEVVTSGVASDENFVKITYPFQWGGPSSM